MHHSAKLCALFVHGRSVKIVDLDIRLGPDRVGQRPSILCKLQRLQRAHLLQAIVQARRERCRELLVSETERNVATKRTAHFCAGFVPEDSKTFLQAKLKPVSDSHPVAGPIVQVPGVCITRGHCTARCERAATHSCATTRETPWMAASVAEASSQRTYLLLNMFRPLFSMAPIVKSGVATMLY